MFEGLTDLSITTKELQSFHQNIASVTTQKLSSFLGGLSVKTPEVKIKYSKGQQVASTENKKVALRPLIRFESKGTFEIPARFTIHEVAHLVGDEFLEVEKESDTDTAVYLSEGLAEYLSIDDPTHIYDGVSIIRDDDDPNDTYRRIRDEIKSGGIRGETIKSYFSLDKIFTTHQPDLEKEKLTEAEEAKQMVPYIVGGTLVRFIVEKGGIESLKHIMQKVQVKKKYAYGWDVSREPDFDYTAMENLEEENVRELLKEAIKDKFGDVEEFEKDWKKTVLGESRENETEQNPRLRFQLDDNLEVQKITECLIRDDKPGGMDMRRRIIESHPKLANLISLQPGEIEKGVRDYILEDYSNNAAKYQENAASMEKEWRGYASEFYEAARKFFPNTKWPKGKYVGYLSISPPFPRFIEDKIFQLPANLDGSWLQIASHEMLHFMFYEYVRQRYLPFMENTLETEMNKLMVGKLKVPLWELSEVFNMIVLSHERFGRGRTDNQTSYSNLKSLRDEMEVLWQESNEDIDKFFSRLEINGSKE